MLLIHTYKERKKTKPQKTKGSEKLSVSPDNFKMLIWTGAWISPVWSGECSSKTI